MSAESKMIEYAASYRQVKSPYDNGDKYANADFRQVTGKLRAVKDMLTELVEMIDTGSQRDLERADELAKEILNKIAGDSLADGDRAVSLNAVLDLLSMKLFGKDLYKAIYELPSVTQPCKDAISREKVMMELDKYLAGVEYEKGIDRIIAELPSITPERLKGHWKGYTHSAYHGVDEYKEPIWKPVNVYHCSECNRRTVIKDNFCPSCGADMREDGETE